MSCFEGRDWDQFFYKTGSTFVNGIDPSARLTPKWILAQGTYRFASYSSYSSYSAFFSG